jgi:hypothetical protein
MKQYSLILVKIFTFYFAVKPASTFRITCAGSVRVNRLELIRLVSWRKWMRNSFRYFKTSPEIIGLAVMMYVHFPLSLLRVEDAMSSELSTGA